MKIGNNSLPYPVLGNSDDIKPLLPEDNISVATSFDNDKYTFHITLKHENPDIEMLLKAGLAEYSCEVTCPRTYLRFCKKSPTPEFEITLGRREVYGRIEFACYVIAREDIAGYHNSGQHEDYGDASFNLESGDVLVAFYPASYNADLKYEKLYAAGSFMVVLDGGDKPHTWFDANDDNIKVYLPHAMFEQFRALCKNRNFNELFHASIVFNALFKVLNEYSEKKHGDFQWAEAIKYRIDQEEDLHQYDITDTTKAYELAQAFLRDPYQRLFNHLAQSNE